MRMMFATNPAMAKRWASETPNIKDLPLKAKAKSGYARKKEGK
jgi:hypothetical protein